MKLLNGSELAGFIKERQARQVRSLRQSKSIQPKLAIVVTSNVPAIQTYMWLKTQYGEDVSVDVDIHNVKQGDAKSLIDELNSDPTVHGIIVQLPLADVSQTDELVNRVAPEKDVDALGENVDFEPATPMAIMWLLAGYNIDLAGKRVLLVGHGKLVGAPLEKILNESGVDVRVVDRDTGNLEQETIEADVVITATGNPAIISADMIKQGAIVVDAGVAGEQGKTVGDLADDVYERDDLTITPKKGGVGPLTVCALFENVILAASRVTEAD